MAINMGSKGAKTILFLSVLAGIIILLLVVFWAGVEKGKRSADVQKSGLPEQAENDSQEFFPEGPVGGLLENVDLPEPFIPPFSDESPLPENPVIIDQPADLPEGSSDAVPQEFGSPEETPAFDFPEQLPDTDPSD